MDSPEVKLVMVPDKECKHSVRFIPGSTSPNPHLTGLYLMRTAFKGTPKVIEVTIRDISQEKN